MLTDVMPQNAAIDQDGLTANFKPELTPCKPL